MNRLLSGGYEVSGNVEIKSGNFTASGELWFTTGELYTFYKSLLTVHQHCSGKVEYSNFDRSLNFELQYKPGGIIEIKGRYQEHPDSINELIFEIHSDQSYINNTIEELKELIKDYGNLRGIIQEVGDIT
ncbi:WapI family immunity protein [Paenibacillus tarimensis]